MSKQIRISDQAYELLEAEAKKNHRSLIADQVDATIALAYPLKSFDQPTLTQEYINEATRPLAEKLEQDKE